MTDHEQLSLDPRVLAHADGPATSHIAARADPLRKETHRYAVLVAFAAAGPASTAELADRDLTGLGLTELRRRATDLLNLGLIERTEQTDGRRRPGYRLAVTDAGRRALL